MQKLRNIFSKRPDFKGIKFPVKIRNSHKIEKQNLIGISVFTSKNKDKYPNYISRKCFEEKHVKLLLVGKGGKKHYILINDFNRPIHDHLLHHGRKHFYRYCLHTFITEDIVKCHIKDCFKTNGKQTVKMPKKSEYVKFKSLERKINLPIMIFADCESILVPEDNKKQYPKEPYTNKYQKHVACSYRYKLVCFYKKDLRSLLNHT